MAFKFWFPTQIYDAPLLAREPEAFTRAWNEECSRIRDTDEAGRSWCVENYPGGHTSYGTLRNLHRTMQSFTTLEERIWTHVRRFCNGLDLDLREANLAMTDCWVNIMTEGGAHMLHAHA